MPIIGQKAHSMNGMARWTTIYGVVINEQAIVQGRGITAPLWGGVYLLTIQEDDGSTHTFSIIVQ